jgi:ABC-type glycerol-3-phosphate transport system substrate-binding protein
MSRYRIAGALVVILALAAVLSGCGPDKPTLTFMYWSDYGMAKAPLTAGLARFAKSYPNLPVTQVVAPYGSTYYQKLIVMFGAQSAPDVFFISAPYFGQYAANGGMQDVTARATDAVRSGQLTVKQSDLRTCTYRGKVYGVPVDSICYAISNQSKQVDASWTLIEDMVNSGFGHYRT